MCVEREAGQIFNMVLSNKNKTWNELVRVEEKKTSRQLLLHSISKAKTTSVINIKLTYISGEQNNNRSQEVLCNRLFWSGLFIRIV
jgi:hypothetical protein